MNMGRNLSLITFTNQHSLNASAMCVALALALTNVEEARRRSLEGAKLAREVGDKGKPCEQGEWADNNPPYSFATRKRRHRSGLPLGRVDSRISAQRPRKGELDSGGNDGNLCKGSGRD
jgi:hypothetical protein